MIRYFEFRDFFDRTKNVTEQPLSRTDVLRMIKRRAMTAGLPLQTWRVQGPFDAAVDDYLADRKRLLQ